MPTKSRWTIDIPKVSLPTLLFTSPTEPLPQTPAFISAKQPDKYYLSLSDYRLYAQRLASGLLRAGLKPGDRVLLFSGNTLFFPSVFMGVIMARGIFTGANPTYVARELAYQLKDSGAKFLICAEGSLDTGLEAAKEAGLSSEQVFIFDDGAATFEGTKVERDTPGGTVRYWTSLLDSPEAGRAYQWPELKTKEELDEVIALNYSSGTTGLPKGVMITHYNYVANCIQSSCVAEQHPDYEGRRRRARQLCMLPMYHAMAQTIFCVNSPRMEVPVYVMGKFDFLEMLQCVEKFKITNLTLVPPIVVAMAKHPATRKFDLSSVIDVGAGAAPLGRDVCAEFEKLWPPGQVNVKQGWGMTEATCVLATSPPTAESLTSAVGEMSPNCESKIVLDDEGKTEAAQGQSGEIWVRGPNVMKGYWNKPQATADTITADGWLKTGDVAYIDKDKLVYIVDRKKELIKVKGLQVAPAELEALLLGHPAVQDAAVIGSMATGEELPRAYIVTQSTEQQTPEVADDIKAWLAQRVSKAKRLEGGVKFLDAIPKNPSGKILRKLLRERAAMEDKKAKL